MARKTLTGKILEFIDEFPGATLKEIAEYLEISPALTRSLIYKLKNNGYIEKAGKGYVLTKKGEWFVQNILKKATRTSEETEKEVEKKTEEEKTIEKIEEKTVAHEINIFKKPPKEEPIQQQAIESLMKRMNMLEEHLKTLESRLQELLEELENLKKQISLAKTSGQLGIETQKTVKENLVQPPPRQKRQDKLPEPIMSIQEARHRLGTSLDTLIRTGKVEIIGNLVVDSEFYELFKKRFPLSIRDAEKLPPMEKRLLEEMNREAIVIIHAGKYYKLVK
ncbi:MAG: winged helix-turn-helix transcriptional regulator [Staphylothermus sp.]|nr:winged helix-turn-helix transcriptional regulator [Staphylothermus sp.]